MGIHTLGQAVTDNSGFVVSHGSAARGSNLATALPVFHQKQGRTFFNQIKGRGGGLGLLIQNKNGVSLHGLR